MTIFSLLLRVIVDPDFEVEEVSDTNNERTMSIWAYPLEPDLLGNNVWFSSSSPTIGDQIGMKVRIQNTGGSDVSTAIARVIDIAPSGIETQIWEGSINSITKKGGRRWSSEFNHTFVEIGAHTIKVIIDPNNLIAEFSEANNVFYSYAQGQSGQPQVNEEHPNVRITSISTSPTNKVEGSDVTTYVTINNNGDSPLENVQLQFMVDDQQKGFDSTAFLDLGQYKQFSFTWTAEQGNHEMKVFVDPYDLFEEDIESDNIASTNVYVYHNQPDLTTIVSGYPGYNIYLSDQSPEEQQEITISAKVINNGGADAYNIPVRLYDGLTFIGEEIIDYIGPFGSSSSVSMTYTFSSPGSHTLGVSADPINEISEYNEYNNNYTRTVSVAAIEPADLISSCISLSNYEPVEGDSVDVFFSNKQCRRKRC